MARGSKPVRAIGEQIYSDRTMAANREAVAQPPISGAQIENRKCGFVFALHLRQDDVLDALERARTYCPLPLIPSGQVLVRQSQIVRSLVASAPFCRPDDLILHHEAFVIPLALGRQRFPNPLVVGQEERATRAPEAAI